MPRSASTTQNIATAPIAYAGTASAQRGHAFGIFTTAQQRSAFAVKKYGAGFKVDYYPADGSAGLPGIDAGPGVMQAVPLLPEIITNLALR